jgi:hypothetical protein
MKFVSSRIPTAGVLSDVSAELMMQLPLAEINKFP